MKKIKALLLIVLGYTIGEFVTGYRLDPDSPTLKSYTKDYLNVSRDGFKTASQAGEDFWINRERAKRTLKALAFPNR